LEAAVRSPAGAGVTIAPVVVPGGKPTIAPGEPTEPPAVPDITDEPVFVTVLDPRTPKLLAAPRFKVVAAFASEGRIAMFNPSRSATASVERLKYRFMVGLFQFLRTRADPR